ncbi:molecular chaperone DnaK [Chitinophaga polysaccharea]|uniref:Molecular chaperone DnaK n=1 Tax=Chitinophaga polysaccharea TaxID=1293035 RepID=A0A561PCH7_9BACT|nr:Hsp70 family protein [Chitinophaga polysaccharea]TWF35833.1 molecular chaperone DnaK [Chitinophaga polysaccharea]
MNNQINFGIDLGTTNSLIGKFQQGAVEIFKNPFGQKETLPSVVAFRKDRIIVGDKARELIEKDPENVFSSFKRKMGTSESFFVPNTGDFKTPVELSAIVLRELKNFIYTGEKPEAVVITIPASFDTIQSNATKKAGNDAGFSEVLLLQEPIAASLAFANKQANASSLQGQWLVYDLGGGTFDVALVKIVDGEMRVIDHEGDNYLGGVDFDIAVIEQLVVPQLQQQYALPDLLTALRSARGKYNTLYHILLKKAEEVKIQLTNSPSAEMEFSFDTGNGEEEVYLTVTREQFERVIYNQVQYSIDLVRKILERNQLSAANLEEVVMIGGSTYIPLVKQQVAAQLGIPVNCSVDPTTAVATGAAWYAGTRTISASKSPEKKPVAEGTPDIHFRTAYQKNTADQEEYFTAVVTGPVGGLSYRIVRTDGGYDSGIKALQERISEMLLLAPNSNNIFNILVFDAQHNEISLSTPIIEITQGKFNIHGQPLPNDICIEIDDPENNTTKLELIFEKNAILPLRKTIVKEITKTILRTGEDSLLINVLEGSRYAIPGSCVPLGMIEIKNTDLITDLVKGSDVEITLQISESRDLSVKAVLLMNEQEFSEVFNPLVRKINTGKLLNDIRQLRQQAAVKLKSFNASEQYELAATIQNIQQELDYISHRLEILSADDITDEKYQLEEKKRKLSQQLDSTGKEQQILDITSRYFQQKENCQHYIQEENDSNRQQRFEKIIADESSFLSSRSYYTIKAKIDELNELSWEIRRHKPETWISAYYYYANIDTNSFTDPQTAARFKEIGEKALERKNYDELKVAVNQLYNLMPDTRKADDQLKGTGIS